MKIIASLFPGILRIALPVFILFATSGCQNTGNNVREYGWFDFVIPDTDSLSNDIDMSFLNESAAGASGFVTVKNGHFIDGKGGRIRFFGTNLTFGSCFPDRKTAVKIAARLRKLGMNVVRFHHMDNQSAPNGIWDQDRKNLDPGQLEKLDWLIYQLRIHGIYTNINTHVSYTYPGMDYKDAQKGQKSVVRYRCRLQDPVVHNRQVAAVAQRLFPGKKYRLFAYPSVPCIHSFTCFCRHGDEFKARIYAPRIPDKIIGAEINIGQEVRLVYKA